MGASSKDILFRLARPMARVAFKLSLPVQEVLEAVKGAYIACAVEELERSGEKANISRLSVLTGLHRREVDRLYRGDEVGGHEAAGILHKVLGSWCFDKRFCGESGKPRTLSHGEEGSEFNALVSSVSKDIHPGTLQFEMERRGLIKQTAKGVRLVRKSLESRGDELEAFEFLCQDLSDLTSCVLSNLTSGEDRELHATTEFDNIPESAVPSVRAWMLAEGTKFHARVKKYLSSIDQDFKGGKNKERGFRVALGTFAHSAPVKGSESEKGNV